MDKVIATYQHKIDRQGFYSEATPIDDARFIVGDLVTRVRTLQAAKRSVEIKVDETTIKISTEVEAAPTIPNAGAIGASQFSNELRDFSPRIGSTVTEGKSILPKPLIAGEVTIRNTPGGDLALVFAPRWTDMAYIPAQFLDELAERIRAAKRIQRANIARVKKEQAKVAR